MPCFKQFPFRLIPTNHTALFPSLLLPHNACIWVHRQLLRCYGLNCTWFSGKPGEGPSSRIFCTLTFPLPGKYRGFQHRVNYILRWSSHISCIVLFHPFRQYHGSRYRDTQSLKSGHMPCILSAPGMKRCYGSKCYTRLVV